VCNDHPRDPKFVVVVDRWSLLTGGRCLEVALCYKNWNWEPKTVVAVDKWSLFGGGLCLRFDCTFKSIKHFQNWKRWYKCSLFLNIELGSKTSEQPVNTIWKALSTFLREMTKHFCTLIQQPKTTLTFDVL